MSPVRAPDVRDHVLVPTIHAKSVPSFMHYWKEILQGGFRHGHGDWYITCIGVTWDCLSGNNRDRTTKTYLHTYFVWSPWLYTSNHFNKRWIYSYHVISYKESFIIRSNSFIILSFVKYNHCIVQHRVFPPSDLTMNTCCLKVKNSQGHKSKVQRDHSVPAGYNISHQLHVGHKSNTAASWLRLGTRLQFLKQKWSFICHYRLKGGWKTLAITTLTWNIQTALTTLSALGNKAWLDILLAAVRGLQRRGEVVADRRDGEEKEGETGDACLGFTAVARSPSSWPYCFTGQPL